DLYEWMRGRNVPMGRFCQDCINPLTGLKGQVLYEGDAGFPLGANYWPSNKNNFTPRINFSWSPFSDQKTVIRGGYNMLTSNSINANNFPGAWQMPGWQQFVNWDRSAEPSRCDNFSGQCLAFSIDDTTTDKGTLTSPAFNTQFPAQRKDPLLGEVFNYPERPAHDPLVQMWGLEIERELPANLALSVGYVGNRGTHLFGEPFRNLSYVPTSERIRYRTAINAQIPITDVYSGQTAARLQEVYGSPTLSRSRLLRTYPFFPSVSAKQYDGTSIYHGMNVRLQKRFSHGLHFIMAYTLSKKITNASLANLAQFVVNPVAYARSGGIGGRAGARGLGGDGDYQDPDNRADRIIAIDDIPQMFNLAGTYELPFGKNKPFLNGNGVMNAIFGGWKTGGTFNAQAGLPLTITCPSNRLTSRCNLIGDPQFSGDRTKAQRINQWLNPAAFEPAFGSDESFWANPVANDDRNWRFGNAGRRLPGARSPGFWNLDASLFKQVRFSESRYLEFRWEVFNALNHQNLGLPNTGWCLPPGPNGETNTVRRAGCSFGQITDVQTDPRSMQFGMKFHW
ncbi:MAG: hypothetical protein L0312_16025, partial [Acidobacteria bacterium]|nr:hypothetical protein [Acidobacteriota bacterium]